MYNIHPTFPNFKSDGPCLINGLNNRIGHMFQPLHESIYFLTNHCFKITDVIGDIHITGTTSPWKPENQSVHIVICYPDFAKCGFLIFRPEIGTIKSATIALE